MKRAERYPWSQNGSWKDGQDDSKSLGGSYEVGMKDGKIV